MLWVNFLLFLIILVLVYFSLQARIKRSMYREAAQLPEFKSSYLSEAITNLVATAGGIYIAVFLLINFLQIDMPTKVYLGWLTLEPVATLAFVIALLQPIVSKWWQGRRN